MAYSARRFPEPAGNLDRVDAGLLPPRAFVAGAMHRTMMPATEWDRELVADLAAKCAGLRETEVVGVRGLAAADEARLLHDIAQVLSVAIAPRGSEREDALVDALRVIWGDGFGADGVLRSRWPNYRRIVRRSCSRIG